MSARRQVKRVATWAPRNEGKARHKIMLGIPTLGTVRMEWHNAMESLVTPTNFALSKITPLGFLTADAQNIIANEAMAHRFDWVLLVEDDTLPPPDLYQRLRSYVESGEFPLVSGLYHLKTDPPEPMVYRGRGNGPFLGWKPGTAVRVDGLPTGCTLVSVALLRAVADRRDETYSVRMGTESRTLRRVFHTPREVWTDPKSPTTFKKAVGTSDLDFCDYVMDNGLLKVAGWPQLAKSRYPFVVDTRIVCGHIDRDTGRVY